jgi:thiosulfate/3-mercaptopyruvate sulfurtransferase
MLAGESRFQEIARSLGIDDGEEIVVYDTSGLFSAARVWWNFRVMGAKNVRVLDGGLPVWRAAQLPHGNFTARFNPDLMRSFEEMLEIVEGRKAQVVDARGAPRFRGEAPEPRAGVQSGHIPGSYNLHYARLVGPDGTLKPTTEGIRPART